MITTIHEFKQSVGWYVPKTQAELNAEVFPDTSNDICIVSTGKGYLDEYIAQEEEREKAKERIKERKALDAFLKNQIRYDYSPNTY